MAASSVTPKGVLNRSTDYTHRNCHACWRLARP
jgi:hypothetical protein